MAKMTATADISDTPELWEKQPDESANQYIKFCRYRDMRYTGKDEKKLDGVRAPFGKRSIRGLAAQLGIKTHKELGRLSVAHNWIKRCEAYDLEMEQQARMQAEQDILKMRKDHADLAAQMIKKAAKRLLTIPEEEISAADLVRLVDVGVKIERLSRGESTENRQISGETTVTHTGAVNVKASSEIDLSDLTDEELGQLEGLLEKLHPLPEL